MEKLTGKGIPSNHLVGEVGQWYEDTNTGDIYECRIANKYSTLHGAPVGGYVWERRMRGEDVREFHSDNWDNLENRPFYEDVEKTEIFIQPTKIEGGQFKSSTGHYPGYNLTIFVTFDDVTYQCESKVIEGDNATNYIYVYGNPSLISSSYDSTGLPFAIMYDRTDHSFTLYAQNAEISHTIEAFNGSYKLKRLDTKYLPPISGASVGQMAVVKSVDENNKPIEWECVNKFSGSYNDLEDKPFYYDEEIIFETICENLVLAADYVHLNLPSEYQYYFGSGIAGQKYKIVLNGETYYATLTDYTQGAPLVALGNLSMFREGEIDNGLPFVIVRSGMYTNLKTLDDSVERTISIYHVNDFFKLLDEKFIPDTIARTEDIPVATSVPDAAGETVTASEFNALLTALRNAGLMQT